MKFIKCHFSLPLCNIWSRQTLPISIWCEIDEKGKQTNKQASKLVFLKRERLTWSLLTSSKWFLLRKIYFIRKNYRFQLVCFECFRWISNEFISLKLGYKFAWIWFRFGLLAYFTPAWTKRANDDDDDFARWMSFSFRVWSYARRSLESISVSDFRATLLKLAPQPPQIQNGKEEF